MGRRKTWEKPSFQRQPREPRTPPDSPEAGSSALPPVPESLPMPPISTSDQERGPTLPPRPPPGLLAGKFPLKISNIPTTVEFNQVVKALSQALRPPTREKHLKFTLQLDDPVEQGDKHAGSGLLYLENRADAKTLTNRLAARDISIGNNRVYLEKLDGALSRATHVRQGFQRPVISQVAQQRKREASVALHHQIRVNTIQFGVLGHDGRSFSIEWEGDYDPNAAPVRGRYNNAEKGYAYLKFNEGREDENPRSLQIETGGLGQEMIYRITIPMNQIESIENGYDIGQPFIILSLYNPPSFETRPQHMPLPENGNRGTWKRLSHLNDAHSRVVGFASRALRLILTRDEEHLQNFIEMSRYCHLPALTRSMRDNVVRADLFSRRNLDKLEAMYRKWDWTIVFQCEALLRNCLLTANELLELRSEIQRLVDINISFAEEVLKLFVTIVPSTRKVTGLRKTPEPVIDCLRRAEIECNRRGNDTTLSVAQRGTFRSRHVMVTPTSYQLEGPYSEQSNRVLRYYGPDYDCFFLRVAFSDEGGNLFRKDYEVDNEAFIAEYVGGILKSGITIAGRHFSFLAYSSSGLRQHSVWFVAPFRHPELGIVDAYTIRAKLGNFQKDIKCPARYGARISLAFSSTDPSIAVKPDEIRVIPDVKTQTDEIFSNGKPKDYTWTDGVGTISPDLADAIWRELCNLRPHAARKQHEVVPSAYQERPTRAIRMGGYKGVVCIDYRLKGERVICVRESMHKFDAPDSLDIEISQAFNSPSLMYLNRPLIMLLDTLGVQPQVFLELQDEALQEATDALSAPESSATLLGMYMLGDSYDLPKLFARLKQFDLQDLHSRDPFIRQILVYALYHVKREIKYHTRILVRDSWTLVGVADEHDVLQENEIYACVHERDKGPLWLEGDILISRSPTVHPGDVQMVKAIGKPDPGTPYAHGLENCVVFSNKGKRPLPNCLGGGDLDGDVYNLILHKGLHPKPDQLAKPAEYDTGDRRLLERDSTIDDIADFVVDYINSDTLGLIGANQVRLADQRPQCMWDTDCLRLAQFHSIAVDYPKTGVAVRLKGIPKPPMKPDWCCPESTDPQNGEYYESNKALGVLFRAVTLPSLRLPPIENAPNPKTFHRELVLDKLEARVLALLRRYQAPRVNDQEFVELFHRYSFELKYQSVTHHLSQSSNGRLTEEELVIGTILDKTTHGAESRKRKDLMDRLTKQSKELIRYIKNEVAGSPNLPKVTWLARAWTALGASWKIWESNLYGARSFSVVILSTFLDALDAVEIEDREQRVTGPPVDTTPPRPSPRAMRGPPSSGSDRGRGRGRGRGR